MHTWSFHLQIFFLGHRAQQHWELAEMAQSAICDRSIYEDAYIFVRALHQLGNLSDRDYLAYRRVFDLVVAKLPPPDLLIYLRAPVKVLIERIRRRARAIETGITSDYLALLESFYDDWMATFDLCPVLTIRTDDLDFVHKAKHLDIVVQRINEKLAGREELVFPPNS
jgi:deoxyadenosine/deoxycytidine kinase